MNKQGIMDALNILRSMKKKAFVPAAMAGAAGGAPPGGMPMDPSMMGGGGGGGGGMPMDPAMMGGAPPMPPGAGGGMPVPPEAAMGMMPPGGPPPPGAGGPPPGPPPGGGGTPVQVNLEDLVQLFQAVAQETQSAEGGGGAPNEPDETSAGLSERVDEMGSKLDSLVEMLTGGDLAAPPAGEVGALPPGLSEAMMAPPGPPAPPMPPMPPAPPMPPMGSPMTPVAGGAAPPMTGMMPQASDEGMKKSAASEIAGKIGRLAVSLRKQSA